MSALVNEEKPDEIFELRLSPNDDDRLYVDLSIYDVQCGLNDCTREDGLEM